LGADTVRNADDSENLEVDANEATTIVGNCRPESKQTALTETNVKMLVRAHDILGGFNDEVVDVHATQGGGIETVNPQAVRNNLKELLVKAKTNSLTREEYGELYENVTFAYRIIASAHDSANLPSNSDESRERLAAASFWLAQLRFNMAQQSYTDDKQIACQDLKNADDKLSGMKFEGKGIKKSVSIDEISRGEINQYKNTCFIFKEIDTKTGKIVYWPATHSGDRKFAPIFNHPLTHAQMVDYMEHQSKILILIKEVLNNLKASIKDFFPSSNELDESNDDPKLKEGSDSSSNFGLTSYFEL
jgi:hypothetical protein